MEGRGKGSEGKVYVRAGVPVPRTHINAKWVWQRLEIPGGKLARLTMGVREPWVHVRDSASIYEVVNGPERWLIATVAPTHMRAGVHM